MLRPADTLGAAQLLYTLGTAVLKMRDRILAYIHVYMYTYVRTRTCTSILLKGLTSRYNSYIIYNIRVLVHICIVRGVINHVVY